MLTVQSSFSSNLFSYKKKFSHVQILGMCHKYRVRHADKFWALQTTQGWQYNSAKVALDYSCQVFFICYLCCVIVIVFQISKCFLFCSLFLFINNNMYSVITGWLNSSLCSRQNYIKEKTFIGKKRACVLMALNSRYTILWVFVYLFFFHVTTSCDVEQCFLIRLLCCLYLMYLHRMWIWCDAH